MRGLKISCVVVETPIDLGDFSYEHGFDGSVYEVVSMLIDVIFLFKLQG
jgi:hypothetical protein